MPKSKVAAKAVTDAKQPKKMMSEKNKASKTISKKTAPAKGGVKNAEDDKEKRKIRHRAGTVALREIKRYQKSTDCLLPRAPF